MITHGMGVISDYDLYLFGEGSHSRIYDKLGAHPLSREAAAGVHFAVWAPNATAVSVVGDFNGWDAVVHPMRPLGSSGVWETVVASAEVGHRYKFELRSPLGATLVKADPFGFAFELPPRSASIVTRLDHEWQDAAWMQSRVEKASWFERPMAIYEVHLGSWGAQAWTSGGGAPHVPGAGRAAGALRQGDGLHAHRAAAGDGASVHRLLGLPGDRLLRADEPLRDAVRFQGLRGRLPSA